MPRRRPKEFGRPSPSARGSASSFSLAAGSPSLKGFRSTFATLAFSCVDFAVSVGKWSTRKAALPTGPRSPRIAPAPKGRNSSLSETTYPFVRRPLLDAPCRGIAMMATPFDVGDLNSDAPYRIERIRLLRAGSLRAHQYRAEFLAPLATLLGSPQDGATPQTQFRNAPAISRDQPAWPTGRPAFGLRLGDRGSPVEMRKAYLQAGAGVLLVSGSPPGR